MSIKWLLTDWLLTDWLTAEWLLEVHMKLGCRSELETLRLRALDKLEPDKQTNIQTKIVTPWAPAGARKAISAREKGRAGYVSLRKVGESFQRNITMPSRLYGGGPWDYSVTPSPNWTWILIWDCFGSGFGSMGTGLDFGLWTRAWQLFKNTIQDHRVPDLQPAQVRDRL